MTKTQFDGGGGGSMTRYETPDGNWTVEPVTLEMTASPTQAGDAPGDGQWLLARYAGRTWDHYATPAALADAGLFDMATLAPATRPEREWADLPGPLAASTVRRRAARAPVPTCLC